MDESNIVVGKLFLHTCLQTDTCYPRKQHYILPLYNEMGSVMNILPILLLYNKRGFVDKCAYHLFLILWN